MRDVDVLVHPSSRGRVLTILSSEARTARATTSCPQPENSMQPERQGQPPLGQQAQADAQHMSEPAEEESVNLLELPAHDLVRKGNCEARVFVSLWRELPSLPLHPCSPLWEKNKALCCPLRAKQTVATQLEQIQETGLISD